MSVDATTFRSVLGQWPTGVTIVTTIVDGVRHGMTASSFSSVSVEPPLVSVALATTTATHAHLQSSGVFAISILAKDQSHVGKRFATWDPQSPDRFAEQDWRTAETGAPVLADGLGWLDCAIAHAYPGGDHTIFVGEVLAAATPRLTSPLLYHSRTWSQLADQLPQAVELVPLGLGPSECSVVEITAQANPLQVRELCRDAILAASPAPVHVRVEVGPLAQANLLTALKSGVAGVEVDTSGTGAMTPEDVHVLLDGLSITALFADTAHTGV